MGTQDEDHELDSEQLRQFTKALLADLRAIETMLEEGLVESGVRRVGAEQELFLVDEGWRPAFLALKVLETVDDSHVTTELGRFNLEFNLDPLPWGGDCLRQMEDQVDRLLLKTREAAREHGAEVVLTGILATVEKGDLTLENMTPNPRYRALNDAMTRLRGTEYNLRIKGQDELNVTHDNVMVEACNTSFQVHFQVGPEEFAHLYNIAQAVAAPVLAAATNSPMLFGKRLWQETRIALFQQSIDTRAPSAHIREQSPRVRFGRHWVDESVIEIFREDISRFRVLLAAEIDEDPFQVLEEGGVPSLQALRLFNSTIYRWNRPCYGISDGQPHLRIENRVLPSGPSVRDEMANAAFWFGLLGSLTEEYDDIREVLEFDDVKGNFVAAARLGLGAQFRWIGDRNVPADRLILEELVPRAREGLESGGIDSSDIDVYLGTLEERIQRGRTGSRWILDSFAETRDHGSFAERLAAIVAATASRQREGRPVHEWEPAEIREAGGWQAHYLKVGQIMTTDLFTVYEDELVDLAASMMDWRKIRHVPVENEEQRLVGLVTHRAILRLLASEPDAFYGRSVPVSRIMEEEVITATPETTTLEAIAMLRDHQIGCLPVVEDDRLVGDFDGEGGRRVAGRAVDDHAVSDVARWARIERDASRALGVSQG
ncbi:MAG: glutamate-cysteine ligase family protein, partial [Thermoanaerobaculia bacterium]|nr:glutamate-cysteine ligase family protein [Thermoanaerobaculia bacterium]